jgi:prepilin-type processing-associated H-X9-DG protein
MWGADPGEASGNADNFSGAPGWGPYAYKAVGSREDGTPAGLGGDYFTGFPPYFAPVRENDVVAPAELYALGDSPVSASITGSSKTGLVTNLMGVGYGNIFGGQPIVKMQHSQLFNMLFADGHVAGVQTNVLFGPNAFYRSKWNHDNEP